MTVKSKKNAPELITIINSYLPESIRFEENHLSARRKKDAGRLVIDAIKEFENFPMNELYQQIIDNKNLWKPRDSVKAVFLERVDPVTGEVRPYFDLHPESIMRDTVHQLKKFKEQMQPKNQNVDNSKKINVDKEK